MATTRNHNNSNKHREKLKRDEVIINPLHSVFDNTESITTKETSLDEWKSIFPQAAIFTEYDDILFEQIITMVYRNLKTDKISVKSITKYGISTYDNMRLNHSSRFWPACENLLLKYQKSNVRRSLAISNLKNSNKLLNHSGELANDKRLPNWDETDAGNLANNMKLMQGKLPEDIGMTLLQLGILQQHHLNSYGMDVIYDNTSITTNKETIEDNNRLVYLLGEQLDHLFDPLLEYSPEQMSFVYVPPQDVSDELPKISETKLMHSIIDELVSVQTSFTNKLVELLQNFIIPLRASVLSSKESSSGITKINQIFPPTIDEITRINRILNDALSKAKSINYIEVLKAVGNILPYFYKPFVRHEANLKDFYLRLYKFANNNKKNIFENSNINIKGYTIREIDGIITGSLMELPRLKLILKRLYETIDSEELKAQNFEYINSHSDKVKMYYDSAIQVIDAFGGLDEETEEQSTNDHEELKQRIFTPTGKILTELATNWPAELQYGWLSRKVVGIYELGNIKSDSPHLSDILIIFSDHLLFLTIVDNQNYLEEEHSDGVIKKISVSDALMHSLVNEKPLPHLDSFPAMEVTAWCNIEDVLASGYYAFDDAGDEKCEYIRFLNTTLTGFKSLICKKHFTRNYKLEHCDSSTIIDLIHKAKLLHKSSPFHLFKSSKKKLNVYYTAHDRSVYENEISQSPFALFLNMKIDVPEYFKMNPNLQLLLQASFIDDKKIQITGYERSSKRQVNEFITEGQFQDFLQLKVIDSFYSMFRTYNNVTKNLIKSNASDLEYIANRCTDKEDKKLSEQVKYLPGQMHQPVSSQQRQKPHHKSKSSEPIMIPESCMDRVEVPARYESEADDSQMKKRKSICDIFKKKQEHEPLVISHPIPVQKSDAPSIKSNVSQTFIPRGTKNEYINTLRPIPTLHQIAEQPNNHRLITPESVVHHQQLMESPDEKGTTDTSTPSIDVLPDFKFPSSSQALKDPILLQEVEYPPVVKKETISTSIKLANPKTIKRISTVDSNRLHLKRKSGNFKTECYKSLPIGIVDSPATGEMSSPNWEAISVSRNSSITTYSRNSSIRLGNEIGSRQEGSNLRNYVLTNERNGPFTNENEEIATRVTNIGSLRHPPAQYQRQSIRKYQTSTTPQRGHSIGSKTLSSTFSVKRTSTGVTTPRSQISPYFGDKFFTTNATAAVFTAPPRKPKLVEISREDSVQSLTPSEIANELAQFIDTEFGVTKNDEPISQYHNSNLSAITLTSSSDDEIIVLGGGDDDDDDTDEEENEEDEQFYSPNEEPNLNRNTSQSESSEATVTSNRFIISSDCSRQSMICIKDESIAELSTYFEKSINI